MVIRQSSIELYNQYKEHMQRIADVRYAAALLQWDQETYMPANGAAGRARQLATLSETAHQWFTSPELEAILSELLQRDGLEFKQQKNVMLTHEDLIRQKKLKSSYIRQLSEAVSIAFNAWMKARKENSFSVFQQSLSALVKLKISETEMLGFEEHPYDALIYDYEKSMTVAKLDKLFDDLETPLKELIEKATSQPVDDSFLKQHFPSKKQWDWGMYLVQQLGFDLQSGRQDISEHPFTTSFNSKDVRITTRIDEMDFVNMTLSCIHETGHALYEQGLSMDEYGLPSGEFTSLSIHESQSRLWENCVGRSVEFWRYQLPVLKTYFPEQLSSVDVNTFYHAINKVEPSFIRTEADELTYHFHVRIRYQIEKELIGKGLTVENIPHRWNELYHKYLGLSVPDDKSGCLQDIHWSHGSFGYFPTYSLGSFYAAQLWNKLNEEVKGVKECVEKGDMNIILNWLKDHIYEPGRLYTSEGLCKRVTGEYLDVQYFLQYAREKF